MLQTLKDFQASHGVDHLRILVVGPAGAGKSGFITSVDTALQGRSTCLAYSLTGGLSGTSMYTMYKLNKGTEGSFFPFVFGDTMGLEDGEKGPTITEIQDILRGDIQEGYTFNGGMQQAAESCDLNTSSNPNDKIHCLVFVLPTDNISRIPEGTIKKMKEIKQTACELKIPVVVLMSKVDEACPLVKKNLTMIYRCTNIRELMEKCSERLNVPLKLIFPVKNYHEEIDNRDEIDVLIFTAVTMIVNFANDFVQAENPWRTVNWSERESMFQTLKDFQANQGVNHLRILIVGPIGAGKSSFITSVDTALQGRSTCLAHSLTGGLSGTSRYTMYKLNKGTEGSFFPFVFGDTMGLERGENGPTITEIRDILRGHIQDEYTFNSGRLQAAESCDLNTSSNLTDKIHCLVFVLPADNISRIPEGTIKKMKEIKQTACELKIPVVVLMSKVDEACPLVKEDLTMIYRSTNIRELMEKCSERLNIPLKLIFPVKNYHEEIDNSDEIDVLIFTAVKMIVNFANDFVQASETPVGKWRTMDWSESERLSQTLKEFKANQNVYNLRILIVGPSGAGKSAFITSVNTALQGRNTYLAHSLSGDSSVTCKYTVYNLNNSRNGSLFPFVFGDTMGLEVGQKGAHENDITSILQGHVREGYTFNPSAPLTHGNNNHISAPILSDKVHCLVFVVPAKEFSMFPNGILQKMKLIRDKAYELELPVVVVMSKVDDACQLVQQNLKMIYKSTEIQTQMKKCNERLGIPLNYIFPVKNYHQEITNDTDMDILILSAVKDMVNFANDFVDRKVKK